MLSDCLFYTWSDRESITNRQLLVHALQIRRAAGQSSTLGQSTGLKTEVIERQNETERISRWTSEATQAHEQSSVLSISRRHKEIVSVSLSAASRTEPRYCNAELIAVCEFAAQREIASVSEQRCSDCPDGRWKISGQWRLDLNGLQQTAQPTWQGWRLPVPDCGNHIQPSISRAVYLAQRNHDHPAIAAYIYAARKNVHVRARAVKYKW